MIEHHQFATIVVYKGKNSIDILLLDDIKSERYNGILLHIVSREIEVLVVNFGC